MKPATDLRVFTLARENLRGVASLAQAGFGDLTNQIRRAAISVTSNIAEATGTQSDREARKFLSIARASNKEVQAQLLILSDLGAIHEQHPLHDSTDHVGAMLHKMIAHLT